MFFQVAHNFLPKPESTQALIILKHTIYVSKSHEDKKEKNIRIPHLTDFWVNLACLFMELLALLPSSSMLISEL